MPNKPGNPNIRNIGFGSPGRTKEFDDAARQKGKGVPKQRKWTKELCVIQLEEIMDLLRVKIEEDSFKDLQVIIDKMMEIIKYLHPPVQKSLNVNVTTTADAVVERLKNWKEKEQVVVVGEEEEENETE